MARSVQIVVVALIVIALAVAPCPACQPAPAALKASAPVDEHSCCHRSKAPVEKQSPTPTCGWMPADNGPTEAKADTAKIVDTTVALVPALDAAAVQLNVVAALVPAAEAPPGAFAPTLALSLRC